MYTPPSTLHPTHRPFPPISQPLLTPPQNNLMSLDEYPKLMQLFCIYNNEGRESWTTFARHIFVQMAYVINFVAQNRLSTSPLVGLRDWGFLIPVPDDLSVRHESKEMREDELGELERAGQKGIRQYCFFFPRPLTTQNAIELRFSVCSGLRNAQTNVVRLFGVHTKRGSRPSVRANVKVEHSRKYPFGSGFCSRSVDGEFPPKLPTSTIARRPTVLNGRKKTGVPRDLNTSIRNPGISRCGQGLGVAWQAVHSWSHTNSHDTTGTIQLKSHII